MHSVKRERVASLPQISRTAALLLAEAKQEIHQEVSQKKLQPSHFYFWLVCELKDALK